jgi:hypothetical protein
MKTLNSLIVAGISASVVLLGASANAQVSVNLNLSTGAVTSSSPLGAFITQPNGSTGNNLAGFGVGSPPATYLSYAWNNETSPVDFESLQPENGLVYIYDSSSQIPANLVDVVGFLNNNPAYMVLISTVPGAPGYVAPSSLPGGSALSSTLATDFGNSGADVSISEVAGVAIYSPTGQPDPGYIDDGGTPQTYTFTTPTPTAPDGSTTVGLLGMGLLGLAALHRKFARN